MTSSVTSPLSTTAAWRIEIQKRPGTKDPAGHKALDAMMVKLRKDHIKTLAALPPPSK